MARFLFTMFPANDLGLPTRLVPIARMLADRGHEVAVFNPAPAPAKLIEDAGLTNLPVPSRAMPEPSVDLEKVSSAWDAEEMFAGIHGGPEYLSADTALNLEVMRNFSPDVVVDSFGLASCLAARIL